MRRVVATGPFVGHTRPVERLIAGLVGRGHAVTWYTGADWEARATALGAGFLAMDPMAVALVQKPGACPLDQHVTEAVRVAPIQARDFERAAVDADAVLADPITLGPQRWAREQGIPAVVLGIVPALYVDATVDLYLQYCVDGFEYPRPDVPQLCPVGPLLPLPEPWEAPAWWPERPTRPIVAVVQGTLDTDPTKLVAPAVEALAGMPELDGIVVGDVPGSLPPNVHAAPWIPYERLLSVAGVLVTNGGYGGVTMAYTAGVPVIVAGTLDDKTQVGERVEWAGIGLDLKDERPTPEALREAIKRVATTPRFVERAREFAGRAARTDAVATTVFLVEQLVRERQRQVA